MSDSLPPPPSPPSMPGVVLGMFSTPEPPYSQGNILLVAACSFIHEERLSSSAFIHTCLSVNESIRSLPGLDFAVRKKGEKRILESQRGVKKRGGAVSEDAESRHHHMFFLDSAL